MKYQNWLSFWLENYVKPSIKVRTYKTYRQIIKDHIQPKLGNYRLNDLSPAVLQIAITNFLSSGNLKTGKNLSASTVNLIITIIQNSLKAAFLLGKLKVYSADKIKRPQLKQKNITCFSYKEQKIIEQAVITDGRHKMFGVVLCLYTGLRIGELLALTWADIDLKRHFINVNKTCINKCKIQGNSQIINEPKTESSKRSIPIPKQLIKSLRYLKTKSKCKYVISEKGEPVCIRSYQRSFELLLKKIHIRHKGFHSLRHTFATRALECGMDVKTLSEILGHKSATITLNRYTHSLIEHKTEMMNKIGRLF